MCKTFLLEDASSVPLAQRIARWASNPETCPNLPGDKTCSQQRSDPVSECDIMSPAYNKRKRKNNTRSSAVNSNKNGKQTLNESSEKTQSDKLQCNKTKKVNPTPQSDSDPKHTTLAPKLNKNAQSEHPTSTQANMTQKPLYNIHTSNSYETLNDEDIDNMKQDDKVDGRTTKQTKEKPT
ncbi:hypothetical protein CBL_20661 [Carabus blaptoides fortunei]